MPKRHKTTGERQKRLQGTQNEMQNDYKDSRNNRREILDDDRETKHHQSLFQLVWGLLHVCAQRPTVSKSIHASTHPSAQKPIITRKPPNNGRVSEDRQTDNMNVILVLLQPHQCHAPLHQFRFSSQPKLQFQKQVQRQMFTQRAEIMTG